VGFPVTLKRSDEKVGLFEDYLKMGDLETATKSGYGAGGTSAMVVDPKQLNFNDHTSERAVQVSNSGNNPLVFTAGFLPNGFIALPKTRTIAPGGTSP
jgi:hypothetical protein